MRVSPGAGRLTFVDLISNCLQLSAESLFALLTILCDLEPSAVIDRLPDRDSKSGQEWLPSHPEQG